MRKDLKTRTPVNCAVDNELNEKLVELSKETKQSILNDFYFNLYHSIFCLW